MITPYAVLRSLGLPAVVLLLFGTPGQAPVRSPEDDGAAKMDAYLKAITGSDFFMGSVAVTHKGKVLLSKGYGWASIEHGIPNGPRTKFDIASVNKPFVATLVLILQEQGKLEVGDPLHKYLSDCPNAWRAVTIRHLLTHTSGIPNYTDLPDQFERRALASFIPDALSRIQKMPLQFEPGREFRYSNTGYKLLIQVIEKASGRSFETFLKEAILDPVGMKDTGVFEKPGIRHLIVKGRATGYTDGTGPLEVAPWVHPSYGGGLYSTVEDLCRWGQALRSGKVLSKKSLALAFTPGSGNYGFGWFVFDKAKRKFVLHGGNIPGSGVTFAVYPDDELEIAVISNLDTAPTNRIHDVLAAIVFGGDYKLPPAWKEITLDPKVYEAYVGRYRNVKDAKFVITVTKEHDRLWNRLDDSPGAATMVLRPMSETRYFNKMFVLYEVTFRKDDDGKVTGLMADGPWGKGEFKRIE